MKIDILGLTGMQQEDVEFQMAPMIDIVFLLLVYFMVTTSIIKMEADLGIQLPGQVVQSTSVTMPDEQIIDIMADGRVVLNSREFDDSSSRDLPELRRTLIRFKQASEMAQVPAMITIQAEDETPHQRVIDVMDAAAEARITHLSFGLGN